MMHFRKQFAREKVETRKDERWVLTGWMEAMYSVTRMFAQSVVYAKGNDEKILKFKLKTGTYGNAFFIPNEKWRWTISPRLRYMACRMNSFVWLPTTCHCPTLLSCSYSDPWVLSEAMPRLDVSLSIILKAIGWKHRTCFCYEANRIKVFFGAFGSSIRFLIKSIETSFTFSSYIE